MYEPDSNVRSNSLSGLWREPEGIRWSEGQGASVPEVQWQGGRSAVGSTTLSTGHDKTGGCGSGTICTAQFIYPGEPDAGRASTGRDPRTSCSHVLTRLAFC